MWTSLPAPLFQTLLQPFSKLTLLELSHVLLLAQTCMHTLSNSTNCEKLLGRPMLDATVKNCHVYALLLNPWI